jgi:hypothetical protein
MESDIVLIARVGNILCDGVGESQLVVDFAKQENAGVRGEVRDFLSDLERTVELEGKQRLTTLFRFTHSGTPLSHG